MFRWPQTTSTRWKPSPIVRLARKPWLYWTITALLSVATMLALSRANSSAQDLRNQWGVTHQALVVTQAVAVGDPLAPAVQLQTLPRALVPSSTLSQLPAGAVASEPLEIGEVLLKSSLRSHGSDLPEGTVTVAVPRTAITPPLEIGNRVLLVLTLDPFGAGQQRTYSGRVLLQDDTTVTVVIQESDLGVIMSGLMQGTVGLARSG